MSGLDPKLRAALKELAGNLKRGGYAPDERQAIVDGATERAIAFVDAHPHVDLSEAVALIKDYDEPEFAPADATGADNHESFGRLAWVALAITLLGIAGLAPIVDANGGDGGSVMVLFAMIGLPVTGLLSWLSRHTKLGRVPGFIACGVLLVGVLLVLMP
jgi:hypothetical protein